MLALTNEEKISKGPIISIIGENPATVMVGSTYTDEGAENVLGQVGNIGYPIVVSNNVDITKVGTYEIVYKAIDADGNGSEVKRIVNVIEK